MPLQAESWITYKRQRDSISPISGKMPSIVGIQIQLGAWLVAEYRTSLVQWGSEYRPFEYRKHLFTQLYEVGISNGQSKARSYLLADHSNTGPVHKKIRWRPFVWYSNGIQKPNRLASYLFLTI